MMFVDARIPVVMGGLAEVGPEDALLSGEAVEHRVVEHRLGCACCVGRDGVGQALGRLFQARARGEVAWFRRVVVVGVAATAVAQALADDPLAAAWFRAG